MTEALPDDGPQRRIFLNALRAYSDTCESPGLTADCPFAVQISPTERGCGEECMDLLARYAEPLTDNTIDLGKGLGAFPRVRPRRGPTPTTRPFDARAIRAVEQELPLAKQSPTSLMLALQDVLGDPPSGDRDARANRVKEIGILIAALEAQGFDAERYAKHVGIISVVTGLLMSKLVPRHLGELQSDHRRLTEDDLPTLEPTLAVAWEPFFDKAGDKNLFSDVMSTLPRIHTALQSASLQQVIAWEPPVDPGSSPPFELPEEDPYSRWVRDRFTETYLHEWAMTSLEQEWQYLRAERVAACEPRFMAMRRIDCNEVSNEIARRQVEKPDEAFRVLKSADRYVGTALEMLEAGRRSAAAAIFEAVRAVAPSDEKAHNNFGFCSAPDQPEEALEALDTAARLGMRHNPMNVGNRMYALGRLGRPASALKAADDLWDHLGPDAPVDNAYMWSYDDFDAEPEILHVDDVYRYVLELAAALAEASGDTDGAETWRQRAAGRQ